MLSRASKIVATLVLLICFVCPLVELFDYWDDSALSGDDTEYGLVVLALCIGVAYTLARFVVKNWTLLDFVARSAASDVHKPSYSKTSWSLTQLLFQGLSPPGLPLRI
jgi:hypothetical protein